MRIRSAILGTLASLALTAVCSAQDNRNLLESKESLYNNIYVYEQPPYRSMTFGHNKRIYTESIYNTSDDKELPVDYTRFMTASLMYAKDVHSILEIGFGGGRTAWYLHRFLDSAAL
jgi:spermidine synthase